MKKTLALILVSLTFLFGGCNSAENDDDILPEAFEGPRSFDSIQDFNDFVQPDGNVLYNDEKENLLSKVSLTDISLIGYSLDYVLYREDVYIASYYMKDGYVYNDKYNDYENERLSTAIYEVSLFPDAQESLKINYIDKDYQLLEIGGESYYYMPEYAENGDLIGHEFAFVVDDNLMYVHLPEAFSPDKLSEESNALDIKLK